MLPSEDESSEKEDDDDEVVTNGKYYLELISLTSSELQARNTAMEAFAKAMEYPIGQIEKRLKQLTLEGRPVKVRSWPEDDALDALETVLKCFDGGYDPNGGSRKDVEKKIPLIYESINDPEHRLCSEYIIQFRLCRKDDYSLCDRVG